MRLILERSAIAGLGFGAGAALVTGALVALALSRVRRRAGRVLLACIRSIGKTGTHAR